MNSLLRQYFFLHLQFPFRKQQYETNSFRATAYRRADIGMSYQLLDNSRRRSVY